MKNHKLLRALGDLAVGKGFYIVLALALTAAGVSGYYLLNAVTEPLNDPPQSVGSQTPVTIPDREPQVSLPTPPPNQAVQLPQELTIPDEEEPTAAPQPVEIKPEPPREEAPKPQPEPTVFTWPVKGMVLREFSVETLSPDPTMGDWRTHAGLDVAASLGTRVLCMTRGRVAEIWEDEQLGTCIRVEHGGNMESVYANLAAQPTVKVGDSLEIGDILGAVGTTAAVESGMPPHLHLEVFRNGVSLDPIELLPE